MACTLQTTSTPSDAPKLSSTVPTSGIYPSTSAQSDGANLTVYAALLSGKFLTLGGEDRLSAIVGAGSELPLTLEPSSGSSPHYSLTMAAPDQQTDVTIHLSREKGEIDSIHLSVPGPFSLGATPMSLAPAQKLSIAVTPPPAAGESWIAYVDGPCTDGAFPLIASTQGGQLQIDPSALLRPKNAAGTCSVTVKIQHQATGKADAAFSAPFSSDIVGVQERRFLATFTW